MSQVDVLDEVSSSIESAKQDTEYAIDVPAEQMPDVIKSDVPFNRALEPENELYCGALLTGEGAVHVFLNNNVDSITPRLPEWQQD